MVIVCEVVSLFCHVTAVPGWTVRIKGSNNSRERGMVTLANAFIFVMGVPVLMVVWLLVVVVVQLPMPMITLSAESTRKSLKTTGGCKGTFATALAILLSGHTDTRSSIMKVLKRGRSMRF